MPFYQFLVEDECITLPTDEKFNRMKKVVSYIFDDDLPIDVIEKFIYNMNWNEQTYNIAKFCSDLMDSVTKSDSERNKKFVSTTEKLADALCKCGYILPSRTAISYLDHKKECPYRQTMEVLYEQE